MLVRSDVVTKARHDQLRDNPFRKSGKETGPKRRVERSVALQGSRRRSGALRRMEDFGATTVGASEVPQFRAWGHSPCLTMREMFHSSEYTPKAVQMGGIGPPDSGSPPLATKGGK
jgi:hypothetical protein